jgi:hypothetical protein
MNATLTTAPVKSKRHTFTLSATIDEATYSVYPVRDIEDPEISKAFTFAKRTGRDSIQGDAIYTVARTRDGRITCECPDYVARHEDNGTLCKHGDCCVRMGLLEAPAHQPGEFSPPVAHEPATTPKRTPSQADIRRSIAFGIALPKPQAAPRAFGEGLVEPEAVATPETPAESCCGPAEAEPCRECVKAPGRERKDFADALADAADRPGLSLAEWLRLQVTFYRGFNTDAADLVAETLGTLVVEAEITRAATPSQLRDRRDALRMDDDRRLIAHGESIGFGDGLAAAWRVEPESI